MILELIGKSICPLKSCSAHRHESWELVYNEKGTGTMCLDDQEIPFGEGSIVVYPPGTMHQKVSQGYFEDYYVMFSSCKLVPQVYVFESSHSEEILQLLKIMYRCYHEDGNSAVCTQLLDTIMGFLKPEPPLEPDIQLMRRMMIERFADADFRVGEVFAAVAQNEDYIRRKFKQVMGMPPHAYLESLRIEHAKKLMSQSDEVGMTIADVAYLSGFYDNLYFSKVFKKHEGKSPSEWKKNRR